MTVPVHPARQMMAPALTRVIAAVAVSILTGSVLLIAQSLTTPSVAATARVGLGLATPYSVVGGQTVTNTGPSVLAGDLAVSPGTAITGFPPGIVGGATHAADARAAQVESAVMNAWTVAAGRAPDATVAGDLVGQTLTPGVYKSAGPLALSGTLTLNAQGNPAAVFIFQVGSTLTTATSSSVKMINGAQACNVYWQIGSSATLGTTSTFKGTIIALASVTVTTGVQVEGRALAHDGAVTLDTDVFTKPGCDLTPVTTSPVVTTTPVTTTPTTPVTTPTTPVTTPTTPVTTPTTPLTTITTPVVTTPTTPLTTITTPALTSPVITRPVTSTTNTRPVTSTTNTSGAGGGSRSGTTTTAAGQTTSSTITHAAAANSASAAATARLAMTGVGIDPHVALAASLALLAGGVAFLVIGNRRSPKHAKASRRH